MTLKPIKSAALSAVPNINHGFFGRQGGVSDGIFASLNCGPGSGDEPEKVSANRGRVAAHLGVRSDNLLSLYQVHSNRVVQVDDPWTANEKPQADAMVTDHPGIALGILTADCGPLLFADPEAGVIGAAHAGWKGALSGVLESTLKAMENLGAKRSRIKAALGPTISQKSYQVGPDFIDTFMSENKDFEQFFDSSSKPGFGQFDLPGFLKSRALNAGLEDLQVMPQCTYVEEQDLFSFRRTTHRGEADYGRNISAICLREIP